MNKNKPSKIFSIKIFGLFPLYTFLLSKSYNPSPLLLQTPKQNLKNRTHEKLKKVALIPKIHIITAEKEIQLRSTNRCEVKCDCTYDIFHHGPKIGGIN